MQLLFYDYETSGMVDWHKPSHMPHQPHICSCSALLTNVEGHKLASIDLKVKPTDWGIEQGAFNTHKLSAEFLRQCGMSESFVLAAFLHLVEMADLRIGHGVGFDERITRIASKRFKIGEPDEFQKSRQAFCTMYKSAKAVGLPPTPRMLAAGRKTNKNPTLEEAYQWATGKEMLGAHQGMYDVMACRAVFFALLDHDDSLLPTIPRLTRTEDLKAAKTNSIPPPPPPSPMPSASAEETSSEDRLI